MNTYLILGASQSLGLATLLDLARDNHAVGVARKYPSKVLPTNVTFYPCDLTNPESTSYAEIEQFFHIADGVVFNAALGVDGLLVNQTDEKINSALDLNLKAPLLWTRAILRARMSRMTKKPLSIVFVGSICGIRGFSGLTSYSATKSALLGLSRTIAREYGAHGVRSNVLMPGYFESDMSKELSPKQKNQIERRTPLGRLAKLEDITPAIRFLLGDGSKFITGQELVVDGGVTT